MLARMWRSRNSTTLLVELQISATALENSVEDPQKCYLYKKYKVTQWRFFKMEPKSSSSLDRKDLIMFSHGYNAIYEFANVIFYTECKF